MEILKMCDILDNFSGLSFEGSNEPTKLPYKSSSWPQRTEKL